jgi:hypothetical protein
MLVKARDLLVSCLVHQSERTGTRKTAVNVVVNVVDASKNGIDR